MTKYAAFGTQLKRGATVLAGVKSIAGPGIKLDTVDVTAHDSTGGWEEVVGTILRSGEITVELAWDPAGATHKNAAAGFLADIISRTAQTWSLVYPGAVTWTFSAFATGLSPTAAVDGALVATATLKITGQPTLT